MSAHPRKLCAVIPKWVEAEVRMAALDLVNCGPAALACLREVADELQKADPSWGAIRDAIRGARRVSPHRYRLNFDRLENRLGHLFSERRRDWAQR